MNIFIILVSALSVVVTLKGMEINFKMSDISGSVPGSE